METENSNTPDQDSTEDLIEEPLIPPITEIVEELPLSESPEIPNEPIQPEKPEPTKFQKILRKVLIWMAGIALVFLAGILTVHYLSVVPLRATIAEDQAVVEEAHEAEMGLLEDQLAESLSHNTLTQVLVDVTSARIALFEEDIVGAKADLAKTQDRLGTLLEIIAEFDENLAKSMPQRLSLITSGLERDTETAIIDLELFTKDLLDIETAIFGH